MKSEFKVIPVLPSFIFASMVLFLFQNPLFAEKQNYVNRLQTAISSGHICYKLTEPEEIETLLGKPGKKNIKKDGGMDILRMTYGQIEIIMGKPRIDAAAPFTLRYISVSGKAIDIGQNRKLVLRNKGDLRKLDKFWGFQNVSLKNLDLSEESQLINTMEFDSLTEWPSPDKLPPDFNPQLLLEKGKNPGLNIRELHKQGINGKGVGIAVIDQPLLLGHEEYTSRIVRYDATGLTGYPPAMHGSPIASIAVGKQIGVAPEATLSYFAVPMWEENNKPYIRVFRQILSMNETLPDNEKIAVISISDGMFPHKKNFEEWKTVLAEVEGKGIFVVTCGPESINYGTLTLMEGKDPDDPENYKQGRYAGKDDVLRIPTGHKTVAGFRGIDVYNYEREGGRSWAAPYLAGLAALAFQVNRNITPAEIKKLLVETASKTDSGPIVNPKAFIAAVKK